MSALPGGFDPEWSDPAWSALAAVCLVGWVVAWRVLPEDKIVPGGANELRMACPSALPSSSSSSQRAAH